MILTSQYRVTLFIVFVHLLEPGGESSANIDRTNQNPKEIQYDNFLTLNVNLDILQPAGVVDQQRAGPVYGPGAGQGHAGARPATPHAHDERTPDHGSLVKSHVHHVVARLRRNETNGEPRVALRVHLSGDVQTPGRYGYFQIALPCFAGVHGECDGSTDRSPGDGAHGDLVGIEGLCDEGRALHRPAVVVYVDLVRPHLSGGKLGGESRVYVTCHFDG